MSELHTLVGAYVVDALDPADREAFEDHLRSCNECRAEVAEFAETLAELSRATAVPPPSTLRDSVLSAIQGIRPAPPETRPEPSPLEAIGPADAAETLEPGQEIPAQGLPAQGLPAQGLPAQDLPDQDLPDQDLTSQGVADELAPRRARRSRWLVALVAAALVAVLGIGGVAINFARQVQQQQAQQAAEASLLSAPDARVYSGTVQGEPVSFVVSRQLDQAMFVSTNLPDPGAGKTYQLWTVPPDGPPNPDITVAGGAQREFLTGAVSDAAALAVSIEDSGGALTPTADQIQLLTKL